MLKLKKIIFTFIFNQIFTAVLKNCEIGSYCTSEKFGCSVYGNCNYRLFEYYKINSTDEEKLPFCDCYHGYSSYDIEVLKSENNILCCYKKKGALTAFFIELFIGLGVGHFYIGNYIFACLKLAIEIFVCVTVGCVLYFACSREHSFESSINEINNNENNNNKNLNENKNNENKNNEMIDENENENDNDSNGIKNNDSKNQSFELEENRENEIMFKNFISCPKSMFIIFFCLIGFTLFHIVDVCLIAFGVFKDENGEVLYMWS